MLEPTHDQLALRIFLRPTLNQIGETIVSMPKKLALLVLLLPLLAFEALAAKVSPSTLTLTPGQQAQVSVSSVSGTLSLTNANPQVVSATLSGTKIQVTALAVGSTNLYVKDNKGTATVKVTVKPAMTVSPTALSLPVGQAATLTISNASGTVRVTNSDTSKVSTSLKGNILTVTGKAAGTATLTIKDSLTTRTVPVQVTSSTGGPITGTTEGRLLASNCFQCHGTYGSGGFEKLLGETEAEIYEELVEYQDDPGFTTDIMAAHTQGYTDAQLRAIAKYLAKP